MPRYTFRLMDDSANAFDDVVDLPGDDFAVLYGRDVVRELANNCEPQTCTWQLSVYNQVGERICVIPFTDFAWAGSRLSSDVRIAFEQLHERRRELRVALDAARASVREARALIARSRGKPYLAADHGRPIIREGAIGAAQMEFVE
jgi:hypothetical protein